MDDGGGGAGRNERGVKLLASGGKKTGFHCSAQTRWKAGDDAMSETVAGGAGAGGIPGTVPHISTGG